MTLSVPERAMRRALLIVAVLLIAHTAAAQRVWTPPQTLTPDTQQSKRPRLALDANGNAVATWIREQATGSTSRRTQASRMAVTGLWARPINLYSPAATLAAPGESTDVALNALGRGAAIWVRATGPAATDLMVQAAVVNGAAWGAAVNLMPSGAAGVASPRVDVDASGNVIAVWVQRLAGFIVVRGAHFRAGASWEPPFTVSAVDEDALGEPALAMDDNGNAVVVWAALSGGIPTLRSARYSDTTDTWTPPESVAPAGRTPPLLRLAINRAGTAAFVAYRGFDGSHDVARAVRLDPATGVWGAPADLSAPGQHVSDVDVAVDESGRATAIWNRSDGTRRIVQTARYLNGWGTVSPRSADTDTAEVGIDTDVAGNAIAVWTQVDGAAHRVRASAYTLATGSWTPASNVSDTSGTAVGPRVRLHADGTGVVVWQSDAGVSRIQASRYVPETTPSLNQAVVTGPSVSLSWAAGAGQPPSAYTVVASLTPGGAPVAFFPVGMQTALTISARDGAYYVRVQATVGGLPISSNEIEVLVGDGPAPTAPLGLAATLAGNIVTLTWAPPVNEPIAPILTYYVEAGSLPGLSNLAFFPTGRDETMYVTGPVPNGSYFVRVRALSSAGVGPASDEIRVVVGPLPPGAPVLSGGATGPGAVVLNWTAAPAPGVPVTGYQLQAGYAPGQSNAAVFNLPASALSFSTTGVPPGVYYVRVVPLSSSGPGDVSNEVVVTVP